MDEAVIKSIMERLERLMSGDVEPRNTAELYFLKGYIPALNGLGLTDTLSDIDPEINHIDFCYFITGYACGQENYNDVDSTLDTTKTYH